MTSDPRRLAAAVRALAMDAVERAKSGHPGMPMGMADVATVLFQKHLKFDAARPDWPDRDRFVLSAGHGSMLIYALLHLTGYADMTIEEIKRFRQLGSRTAGHPEFGHAAGIETTTGPLGQGLANAVGMAMAERALAARFGKDLVDHRTWVIAGDGCLMEGISQEAIGLAGRQKLEKLIVLWDDNDISIDGKIALSDITDQRKRFEASGWRTLAVDGHDPAAIDAALAEAANGDRPTLVACKTVIGFGAPKKAGTKSAHGEPLGAEELAAAKAAIGWTAEPFDIPADIAADWRAIGARGASVREAWEKRLAASPQAAAFVEAIDGDVPTRARDALAAHAAKMAETKPSIATRAASGLALDAVFAEWPSLIGGSADLTGSNNTLVKGTEYFAPETPGGRYVNYGIREHGMAAAMNGLALHGGLAPYGGTFLCFADYSRPAIRLAALMGVRVVHVMTHDSIGLGEDGPTHQPVEHLASLRAIPNCYVFRPADAVETAETWACALDLDTAPSVLALSRQATPPLRMSAGENMVAKGAYVISPAKGKSQVALFASGTEVAIALAAQAQLAEKGIAARVVSCPCFELFAEQDDDYQDAVIGPDTELRIGVEAAIAQGWFEAFELDAFLGMTGFGASAPAKDLYAHFEITPERIVEAVTDLLEG
ncbi:MAG: transketolase [Alphaproteobacteria bacterium]|nr:transketolase [Alphaproteobacteria bacterium]